jgi:hypothetical protein
MRISTITKAWVLVAVLFTAVACWPRGKTSEESELDAISAASKRLFGNNVRGYMWALTTDSPALFAQAPNALGSSSGGVAYDPFAASPSDRGNVNPQVADASEVPTVAPLTGRKPMPVSKLDPLNSPLFQCWYYAETPVYVRLDGEGLRKLFMDKSKTKKINNNFIDVRNLGTELSRSETFRHFESFALSALPGTCFLFSAVGPLRGTAKGALTNAMCSISLASFSSLRKVSADGWGSDKARVQIQNQLKAKADELEEVNWDVLSTLKNKVAEYNSADRFDETTQVQCPLNEGWVAELMGNQ